MKDKALKESIIAAYLTAGLSYRQVGEKRGVDYRSLHRWVKEYQGLSCPVIGRPKCLVKRSWLLHNQLAEFSRTEE